MDHRLCSSFSNYLFCLSISFRQNIHYYSSLPGNRLKRIPINTAATKIKKCSNCFRNCVQEVTWCLRFSHGRVYAFRIFSAPTKRSQNQLRYYVGETNKNLPPQFFGASTNASPCNRKEGIIIGLTQRFCFVRSRDSKILHRSGRNLADQIECR